MEFLVYTIVYYLEVFLVASFGAVDGELDGFPCDNCRISPAKALEPSVTEAIGVIDITLFLELN